MNNTDRQLLYAFMILVLQGLGIIIYWLVDQVHMQDYARDLAMLRNKIESTRTE